MRLQIRLAFSTALLAVAMAASNGDGSRQIADGLEFSEWVAHCGLDG